MKINSRIQLVELMKHLGLPMIAAEVGVAEGRLSKQFLEWGVEKLYLVDIWETIPFIIGMGSQPQELHDANYLLMLENIKGHEDKVQILKGFSYKMADKIPDESLGMVYIDGDHTFQGAKADIDYYWPKLVKGGIMAFHDAANPTYGIRDAIFNFTKGGHGMNMLDESEGIENTGCYLIKQ